VVGLGGALSAFSNRASISRWHFIIAISPTFKLRRNGVLYSRKLFEGIDYGRDHHVVPQEVVRDQVVYLVPLRPALAPHPRGSLVL